MEWIHEYWQILSFIVAHVGYQIKTNFKVETRMDGYEVEMRIVRQRLEHLERLNESGLAARCQVHTNQIHNIEKRIEYLEAHK